MNALKRRNRAASASKPAALGSGMRLVPHGEGASLPMTAELLRSYADSLERDGRWLGIAYQLVEWAMEIEARPAGSTEEETPAP